LEDGAPISLTREFASPPAAVWEALSEPGPLAAWHAERVSGVIEVGAQVTLHWDSLGLSKTLKVSQLDAPAHLTLTTQEGPTEQQLSFALAPTDTGSRLVLTHTGASSAEEAEGTHAGWVASLSLLELFLHSYVGLARHCTSYAGTVTGTFDETFARLLAAPGTEIAKEAPHICVFHYPDAKSAAVFLAIALDDFPAGTKLVAAQVSTWGRPAPTFLAKAIGQHLDDVVAVLGAPTASS